jgi:hypothetical protein
LETDGATSSRYQRQIAKEHKFAGSYLLFGFMCVHDSTVCLMPSVYCYQTVGHLVPAKLQHFVHKKHVDFKEKPVTF